MQALYESFLKLQPYEQIMLAMALVTFIGTVLGWLWHMFHGDNSEYVLAQDDGQLYRSKRTIQEPVKVKLDGHSQKFAEKLTGQAIADRMQKVAPKENPPPPQKAMGKEFKDNEVNTKEIWKAIEKLYGNKCAACGTQLLPGRMDLNSTSHTTDIRCTVGCSRCGQTHTVNIDRKLLFNKGGK